MEEYLRTGLRSLHDADVTDMRADVVRVELLRHSQPASLPKASSVIQTQSQPLVSPPPSPTALEHRRRSDGMSWRKNYYSYDYYSILKFFLLIIM